MAEKADKSPPFSLSRSFEAPRALVFEAWTDTQHLAHWWGPAHCKIRSVKMDLRLGGVFHYGMEMPDGSVIWGKWTFREIVPPERLVVLVSFSDEAGGITHHPYAPGWPREMLSTFSFAEQDGKTKVTIEWWPFDPTDAEQAVFEASRPSMAIGWTGTLDRLETYLAEVRP